MANSKALQTKRALLLDSVESLHENVQRNTDPNVNQYYRDKCSLLRDRYDKLEDEIIDFNASSKFQISIKPERNAVETMIDTIMIKCSSNVKVEQPVANIEGTHARASALHFKPIELPTFSGGNFAQFWEIFESLVHSDQTLSDTIKYHHLLNCLTESTRVVVSGFVPVNANNYKLAVAALKEHYNNPRQSVSNHIQAMLNSSLTSQKPGEITSFISTFKNNYAALQKMNLADLSSVILFQICYAKLDTRTRIGFEQSRNDKDPCTIDQLLEYLQNRAQIADLQNIVNVGNPTSLKPQRTSNTNTPRSLIVKQNTHPPRKCPIDQEEHRFIDCEKFKAMTPQERSRIIRDNKLCVSCFGSHSGACKSTKRCHHCSGAHHSLLCFKNESGDKTIQRAENLNPGVLTPPSCAAATAKPPQPTPTSLVGHSNATAFNHTLLATAIVLCHDIYGQPIRLRCVIDSGSQVNIVSEQAVRRLGITRERNHTHVQGLGGHSKAQGLVKVKIHSLHDSNFVAEPSCLILNSICGNLPSMPIDPVMKILPYADPEWYLPAEVDMLLGAAVYALIICGTATPIPVCGNIVAQPSSLGYMLFGQATATNSTPMALLSVDGLLTSALERFWKHEESESCTSPISAEEIQAEKFYLETTTRQADGRYVVRLPFRTNCIDLTQNKRNPKLHFLRVEQRLKSDPEKLRLYNGYFADLLSDGLMSKAPTSSKYLLLHHAVLKNSTSTSVRPVFDASSPDSNGNSLNSQLLPGPALQSDLPQVLLKFRFQPIPLVADIKRMYNSVMIHPDDRRFQHVLWRPTAESEVQEFELNSVTFGVSSSAFLAQRTVQKLITDEGKEFPLAAAVLSDNTYVDDIVSSYPDIATAVSTRDQLIKLTARGGFELKKFASNHEAVLAGLPTTHREVVNFGQPDASLSVLGTHWNPENDTFSFSVPEEILNEKRCTKRLALSTAARIFDCHGLLTPVTLSIKLFLKKLWETQIDWDTPVPQELSKLWHEFHNELHLISELRIPRVIPVFQCERLELVGFADGSSAGYGAAIYLRCVQSGSATLHLIKAKSKASPVKPKLTIPRMELQACKMLTDLFISLQSTLQNLPIAANHFFSDSSIVLCWLHTPVQRLQVFVSNRVTAITTATRIEDWHHVNSAANCADPASRSLSPKELLRSELWWKGPPFLLREPIEWPPTPPLPKEVPEFKKEKAVKVLLIAPPDEPEVLFKRFSSMSRLVRVMSWVRRFIKNCNKKTRHVGPLTVEECQDTRRVIILKVQSEYLPDVSDHDLLPKSLQQLTPFIAEDSYCRVGGRLENAPLEYSAMHPILLPKESHVSLLLCREAHQRTMHGGVQAMRAYLQSSVWIICVTRILKKVKRACMICYRLSRATKAPEPFMAPLPKTRFEASRAFHNTSCDFCGFFPVHEGPRARAKILKTYVCIFTCMATRAIHLEVVQDLSSDAFLAALDRFVARRGQISLLYCDNGTNFVGGKRLLSEVQIKDGCTARHIKFQFTTPLAPWKNGITERVVALFKSHFIRVIGKTNLTYTEMITVVTRIEAILNSRPLLPITSDPSDGILTPGHFLIGEPLQAHPEQDYEKAPDNTLNRWERCKSISQRFWKIWKNEYLPTLLPRSKWTKEIPNIQVGQLVFLRGENTPPLMWPLGIIQAVHPHKDGTVRVVTVKTANGTYQRPVNLVIPILP